MFTQEQLQDLLSFNANGAGVVSMYLDTDCSQQPAETIKMQVRGMLRELNGAYTEDAEIIERYLNHSYDWSKPGLALFSAASSDYFRAFPVAVAFRNRLRVGRYATSEQATDTMRKLREVEGITHVFVATD